MVFLFIELCIINLISDHAACNIFWCFFSEKEDNSQSGQSGQESTSYQVTTPQIQQDFSGPNSRSRLELNYHLGSTVGNLL